VCTTPEADSVLFHIGFQFECDAATFAAPRGAAALMTRWLFKGQQERSENKGPVPNFILAVTAE